MPAEPPVKQCASSTLHSAHVDTQLGSIEARVMSSKPLLYGAYASTNTRAVALTLKALNVDYEFRSVVMAHGEHLLPSYQQKNPTRTIPVLEVDGRYIGDSHAIMAFLVGKYGRDGVGERLYPRDLYERARIDQRLHHENGVFMYHAKPLLQLIFSRQALVIPAERFLALEDVYGVLECCFGEEGHWIAGGAYMSIADFSFVTTVSALTALRPIDKVKCPKLMDWMRRMESLPYYKELMSHEAVHALEAVISKEMSKL